MTSTEDKYPVGARVEVGTDGDEARVPGVVEAHRPKQSRNGWPQVKVRYGTTGKAHWVSSWRVRRAGP